jgi:starch synthase
MKIAIVTSEAVPFSKTGGLADATGTLFKEYLKMGLDAYLFVPFYKITKERFKDIRDTGIEIDIPLGKAVRKCRIMRLELRAEGLNSKIKTQNSPNVFFIGSDEFFGRDELYGTPHGDYPDNDQRFTFFCMGILETCKKLKMEIDIMHCHDWQTGLVPLYLKTLYKGNSVFRKTKSILTIHNIGYQGWFPPQTMEITGFGWELFNPEGIEFYGQVNFLKAGIIGADVITTVSKTYAKEILTPEYGFGLDGILRKRADSILGILNGLDYSEWDPSSDKFLPRTYTYNKSRISDVLAGKLECKRELMRRCSLKGGVDIPLMCFIGRLSGQKGIDILAEAIPGSIESGANIIIIGKGEERYHSRIESESKRFGGRLFFHPGFDEALAHIGYAGSDIFLMPSRYEPCGLGQMIAMRYGTIPVARRTGGPSDTIEDGKTGFLFEEYSKDALPKGITRAVSVFSVKDCWQRIIKNAMSKDFSSKRSAGLYLKAYSGNYRGL